MYAAAVRRYMFWYVGWLLAAVVYTGVFRMLNLAMILQKKRFLKFYICCVCSSINCVKVKMLYLFCLKYLCCLCFFFCMICLFSHPTFFFWWIFHFINGWGCRNCYMNNFALKNETHYTWKILAELSRSLF